MTTSWVMRDCQKPKRPKVCVQNSKRPAAEEVGDEAHAGGIGRGAALVDDVAMAGGGDQVGELLHVDVRPAGDGLVGVGDLRDGKRPVGGQTRRVRAAAEAAGRIAHEVRGIDGEIHQRRGEGPTSFGAPRLRARR